MRFPPLGVVGQAIGERQNETRAEYVCGCSALAGATMPVWCAGMPSCDTGVVSPFGNVTVPDRFNFIVVGPDSAYSMTQS
jgi:hypothetical protein